MRQFLRVRHPLNSKEFFMWCVPYIFWCIHSFSCGPHISDVFPHILAPNRCFDTHVTFFAYERVIFYARMIHGTCIHEVLRHDSSVCCSVLQCVAVCCSVLQCVAVCCIVLQCVSAWESSHTREWVMAHKSMRSYDTTFQCIAMCCSVLQYVAVCCSVLQCESHLTRANESWHMHQWGFTTRILCVLQCVAVCCSVLQCKSQFIRANESWHLHRWGPSWIRNSLSQYIWIASLIRHGVSSQIFAPNTCLVTNESPFT